MDLINKILKIAISISVAMALFIVLKYIILFINNRKIDSRRKTIIILLINVMRYLVLLSVLLSILYILKIDKTALLASASFLGLVFGFGAQNLVNDMISGFFIIFEDQFRVYDYVAINDVVGEVLEIGLKTTILKTWEGEIHYFSNGNINTLINYSKCNSLAIIDIKVSYDNDIEFIDELIKKGINDNNWKGMNIVGIPKYLGIQESTDTGYILRIIADTFPFEHFGVKRFIRKYFIKILIKNGIKMPKVILYNEK